MRINRLTLDNFRSFKRRRFEFNRDKIVIIGLNGSGKSNLLEAINFLSCGHSKSLRDGEMICQGEEVAAVGGEVVAIGGRAISLSAQIKTYDHRTTKRYFVNHVGRSLLGFSENFACVLFEPDDLQLILGSPDLRRNYLNKILSKVSHDYHRSIIAFERVRRNRNRVLEMIREGENQAADLEFWDGKILELAPVIVESRLGFFEYLSAHLSNPTFSYCRSPISPAILIANREREIAAGVTISGPHRDDFKFLGRGKSEGSEGWDLSIFGSRGEQRMAVFLLKMIEISFLKEKLAASPVLLLDDIFSELDKVHREMIVDGMGKGQVILTTTEKDFIKDPFLGEAEIIEL